MEFTSERRDQLVSIDDMEETKSDFGSYSELSGNESDILGLDVDEEGEIFEDANE